MKNLLLFLFLSLYFTPNSFSQVGIGTTNPNATLHVFGTTVLGGTGTTELLNDGFEDGTLSPFTTSGDELWETTTNAAEVNTGSFSARTKDALVDNESTTLQYTTTITTTGTVSFFLTTSTENNFDFLRFNIDGIQQQEWSGTTTYNQVSFPLATGAHTLTWVYSKDVSVSSGLDRVAIDDVLIEETSISSGSYTFRLEDGQQQDGYVLTSDANGYATWEASGGGGGGTDDQLLSIIGDQLTIESGNTITLPSGGGGSFTFTNGLTEASTVVRLGGTLTANTSLDIDNSDLTFSSSTATFPGEIIYQGNDRVMMHTLFNKNYVNFGSNAVIVDSDDGFTFTDTGGTTFTKDFALGCDAGDSGGSAFAMGSIEYFVDGTDELFYEGSGFSPMTDETSSFGNTLGKSNRRWGAVYATNGVITTSDLSYKKDISKLTYGLKELLQISPITYKWKNQTLGKTNIPNNLQITKIGFSAQQLLKLIPEVVQTHSWVATDENGNYKRVKNDKLGVFYSDLIPVTVVAIQEQQKQIEELKNAIEELKKQNLLLIQLLKK